MHPDPSTPPTVVDLFAGAGGLSLGFSRQGFRSILALDNWQPAVDTYNANLDNHAQVTDLAGDVVLPAADVVVGGPPCQGFSSAGLRRSDDHRTTLVRHFAEIIAATRPSVFVFENVEGFLTFAHGERIVDLLEPLIEAGYSIHLRKVSAANYGVPQHRKRVIAIGGLGFDPGFPVPTHSAFGAPGALSLDGLPLTPTLAEALLGLPQPHKLPPGAPPGHWYRPLSGVDLTRAEHMKPGQRMRDIPEELWHDSYRRRANRRVQDGTASERRGGAPAGLRRLRGDEPSKAITGGARSEFLHPSANRSLTLRECARIQTFPDEFVFSGTVSDQGTLIGNAVPPRLGEAIAKSVMSGLQERRPAAPGLLSFVPTVSEGMSPALKRTTNMITGRFPMPEAE